MNTVEKSKINKTTDISSEGKNNQIKERKDLRKQRERSKGMERNI